MAIDVSPETEARLKAKAEAEGISVATYIERLVSEAESRRTQLASFEEAIRERLDSLNDGDNVDGEEVISRLLSELEEPGQASSPR
jgi:predicted transcriptional regulator